MKNSDQITSSEESLQIITQMINSTRGKIRGGSFQFILWGYVAIIGNVGQYLLTVYTDYPHPYLIWIIALPAWLITFWYSKRQTEKAAVVNYSTRLIMWTWIAFAFSLLLVIFSGKFNEMIPAVVLMLAGMATFITGCIMRFKPLIYGGSSFWIFAAIALSVSPLDSLLVSAGAILLGYLIPGYLIRKENKQ